MRRHEYNRIMDELRHIDMSIEKDEATAVRMRHQTKSSFTEAQLSKISKKNIERKEEREQLTERLRNLDAGLLDNELREHIKMQMDEANEKTRVTRQRKKALAANKEAQSVISKAYYQASRDADRKNRYLKRDMDRSYRHFIKACNSVPDYILRNLSNMPNNKGYIWKSVACYGELPAELGQPTVLFDRRRGGIMVIHEWSTNEYKKYEKQGKEHKVLVHTSARRKRELPPICAEMARQQEEMERQQLERNATRRSSGKKNYNRKYRDTNSRGNNSRDNNNSRGNNSRDNNNARGNNARDNNARGNNSRDNNSRNKSRQPKKYGRGTGGWQSSRK